MPKDQSNRGYFFQSTASEDKNQRRQRKLKNENGNPLRLTAKVSAICVDPRDRGFVFVADNAGVARRMRVEDRKVTHIYRTSTSTPTPTFSSAAASIPAPLTSISTHPYLPILYAGSWDNSLYAWDVPSRRLLRRYTGHADFVKCVVCVRLQVPPSAKKQTTTTTTTTSNEDGADEQPNKKEKGDEHVILISGSADGTIIIWHADTGRRIHSARAHTRGVLDLAVDPASLGTASNGGAGEAPKEIVLFSASSLGEIRRWRVSAETFKETTEPAEDEDETTESALERRSNTTSPSTAAALPMSPITAHDTSVNRLHFPPTTSNSTSPHPNLWTASSDNTVLLLPRHPTPSSFSISSQPLLGLKHPDWVRDVAVDEDAGLVVTACRDEEVRVWDAEDGALVGVLRGHFDAVEAVCLVEGGKVVSGGLDGTVRVWALERAALERTLVEGEESDEEERDEAIALGGPGEKEETGKGVFTTEEEDRELAELMAEDD